MEIKEYAPVVITTLNRYEHFKRCIESLERCTGADKTDVYVGLDYPPSEKYVDGWKKIDAYLTEKEVKNGFRNLLVRRRDHNCGVGKAGSNGNLLIREIKEIADRYISSEDDNEFSPCFLEYMNKALEKFKDDERVVCVCGYTPFVYEGKGNSYFSKQMYAWGVGRWISKNMLLSEYRKLDSLEKILKNIKASLHIYRFRPVMLSRVLDQVIQRKVFGDVCIICYCVLQNRYNVFPSKSLVRNWGRDGTGLHSKKIDEELYIKCEINQDKSFEINVDEFSDNKDVQKQVRKISSKKWYGNMAILLRYLVWRITKKDIFSIRRFLLV